MDIKSSLTYKQMEDGMVILGAIRQITNLSLQMEFPGLTFGQVRITSISDELNAYLREHMNEVDASDPMLKKMFTVGSFVPSKIMKIEAGEKGYKVEASINPRDINSNKRHNNFKKGMLMWASVQSELDHGYQLSNGVKKCNIFLPTKNVDTKKKYQIGQPLWCVVHKCTENQNSSILVVSAKLEHISKAVLDDLNSIYDLIPGMQVEVFVDKVTRTGIAGRLSDFDGYIDQTQLKGPLHTLSKIREGSLINAHVLFVDPFVNVVHLSLRGLEPVPQPKYNIGHITVAEIIGKAPRGLYVKLGKEEKGFITNKRLLKTLASKSDSNLDAAIRKKYPPSSKHQCRIIDFSHMERTYICTFETEIVKEKLFTPNDVTVGALVTGTVEEVKPDGLIICAGHIKGFVSNFHTSNTKYSDHIKKRFTIGSQVNARVWNISQQGNVTFTLKQAFLESDLCLSDIATAKKKQMYPGMVIQLRESGMLVAFYKGIMGWITTKQLAQDLGGHVDPRDYFYQGQVVSFRLLGVKNGRLQLSTKSPETSQGRKRKHSEQTSESESTQEVTTSKKKRKKQATKDDVGSDSGISESENLENLQQSHENANLEVSKHKKKKCKSESSSVSTKNLTNENKSHENDSENIKKNKKRKTEQKTVSAEADSAAGQSGKFVRLTLSSQSEDVSESEDIADDEKEDKSETSDDENICFKMEQKLNSSPIMPGVEDFFSPKKQPQDSGESSSDDETEEQNVRKKKKKLTPAERAELAKQEEERIRKIEKELADCKKNPQTADHFDRLCLAEPNSSELWLRYIAFHVSCMELDKARTVVKRALETIDMTMLQEKLNVWIAYLHLENMYGTKETFDKIFEDAIKYNDPMEIYLKTIEMLAESGKISEMEGKIKKAKLKFKKSPQMWESIGKVYYLQKNYKEARNCKHLAIRSIEDKKTQLNLIVRFAIMEFKYGEEDAGSQVFETILQSDPRKVNIWITYVDQLTKKGRIDLARSVLERSVCQSLPVKSMKTLFMKFRTFEEKHGTPESLEEVKRKAVEFVVKTTS